MSTIRTGADISAALQAVRVELIDHATAMSNAQFFTGTETNWSAADYLKHLILSVKPFAKALTMPTEQLENMFGTSDTGSMSFSALVQKYDEGLQTGFRAEDSPSVVPVNYRFPDGVGDDIQGYLIATWDEANERLLAALANLSEDDLDTYMLPHPAIGNLTLREMCYFTIHHNRMHHRDIQQAAIVNTGSSD